MHFLPDVFVTCDRCEGKRYNKETLAVTYKGKTIADFLAMTVDDAYELLKAHPQLKRKLATLKRVGPRLHPPRPARPDALRRRSAADQADQGARPAGRPAGPSISSTSRRPGLHFDDVRKLLEVLSELAGLGNTVVIIEHNLEVIKYCDYIIDLGPEGGEEGGRIVAQGTPEDVAAAAARSHTGTYLKKALRDGAGRSERTAEDMAFKDIAGNGRVKKILRLALERDRVPNSLLFCGPEGVGKTATWP